jgi:transcriptional regulator with XRE-family HTH domain
MYREDDKTRSREIPPHMVGKSAGLIELPFGAALRRVRLAAGMTQEQLALEAGVQRNFISLIETGQNQPTITTIAKLARALGMRASELVAEAERNESRRRPH